MNDATPPADGRRPDLSGDLLDGIVRDALDPDYAVVAARTTRPRRRPVLTAAAVAILGMLLALACAQTFRARPADEAERQQLIERIRSAAAQGDALRARSGELSRENAALEVRAAGLDEATRTRLQSLELAAGTLPARGPGVRLTVDDGPAGAREGGEVVDADLRVAVNGLWRAGAEAVAVNGHRLTTRTAIRSAGEAITVDYRSLTRPYVVEAIGDPRGLERRFRDGDAGASWRTLGDTYGMRFDLRTAGDLALPADTGPDLTNASAKR
ncbi:DUF881 domain-containing protein [Nigerium massiliense]|uniref:DUF881 domain-containing protein n=1 Tax=Nigerium massiliense TaxID=1522317 RepID=UPI00058EB69C|nr:DUF881 domain-containing protein [Nigerium massiliense]